MTIVKIALLDQEDVYKDILRIPEVHRSCSAGSPIVEGTLCKVYAGAFATRLFLRGCQGDQAPVARMDEGTRNRLGIEVGQEVDLRIVPLGWWGQLMWAWNASEPAYRIAAQLAVLSVLISIVGLVLGVLPFVRKG
jgi:hypothetical protein